MKSINNVLYRIKNIMFLVFLYGSIRLVSNMKEASLIGYITLIGIIIYSLIMFYLYTKKNNKLNENIANNFVSISLDIFVYLLSLKSINQYMGIMYFKFNYIILIIIIIGIIINSFMLTKKGK